MLLITILTILLFLPIIMIWFLRQGAPFVRTSENRTKSIIQSANKFKPKRIVDLGCGDGKLVIALAKAGYKVDGIEIQPWLVWRARRNVKKQYLDKHVNIYWGSFWKFDLSKYDLVVLFGIQRIMPRLERKLTDELGKKARVISNTFVFPTLKVVDKRRNIITYEI